jgi:hypothetical protein
MATHEERTEEKRSHMIFEIFFDIGYLVFALAAGCRFLAIAGTSANATIGLFGIMTLALGIGDSFHLIPRISSIWIKNRARTMIAQGFGKFVTSITMTIYYVLLFMVWQKLTAQHAELEAAVFILAAVRIAICLLPQNRWLDSAAPHRWAVYRNIPAFALGAIVCAIFVFYPVPIAGMRFMPLAITLSFVFYVPVIAFAEKRPAVGALMIPKTLCYVWMITMGFSLPR